MKTEADEALWFVMPTGNGFRWHVLLVHHDHDELHDFDSQEPEAGALFAMCDFQKRIVYLNAACATETIRETLHHEMVHMILHDVLPARLLNSKIAESMEEIVTSAVSPILCRVARPRWPAFPPEAVAVIRAARRRRGRAA